MACSSTLPGKDADREQAGGTGLSAGDETSTSPPRSKRRYQKPRRWTHEETMALVQACKKHGVGAWRVMLRDPEFKDRLTGRTASNLKDRFRFCFPEQHRRLYPNESASTVAPFGNSHDSSPSTRKKYRKPFDSATLGVANLDFSRKGRRPSRRFTREENEALLRGVRFHGPGEWTAIAQDEDLGLGHRRPTDLRDRFRTAFPVEYKAMGYALKERKRPAEEAQENDEQRMPGDREGDDKSLTTDVTMATTWTNPTSSDHKFTG